MHNAYRNYGGKFRGVETAVAEFTQIPPFGYTRRFWGPNWVLDQSMLANHRFKERSADLAYSAAAISGVLLGEVEADVLAGVASGNLAYDAAQDALRFTTVLGSGPYVAARDGLLFVPGPSDALEANILGLVGPFNLSASKQFLYLNFGGMTEIVDLSGAIGYPTPNLTNLVNHINASVTGSPASSYNSKLMLTDAATVWIEPGPNNAAVELFGVRPNDVAFPPSGVVDGVIFRNIMGSLDISTTSTFVAGLIVPS